jgi:hypothetical protein
MSRELHPEQIVSVDRSNFITSNDLTLADQDRYVALALLVRSPEALSRAGPKTVKRRPFEVHTIA